ncbi:heterokaryon incompatibility protein-domain-containing protein, partial [Parachaetomium inaequale]
MGASLYEPLDPAQQEIRLLRIEPGDGLDTIKCELITDSLLQPKHAYHAASYVWGDSTDTEVIYINGHEHQATRNLVAFLRWYRDQVVVAGIGLRPNPIWVDALCINQRDISERNSQVQMMATIYRSATTTFSWLGPEAGDSTYAMQNILSMWQKILEHAKQLPPGTDVWTDPLSWLRADQTDWFQPDLEGGDGYDASTRNRFWRSATKLLSRPYWRRAWVTQEIILSKMVLVVCGPAFVPCPCIWDVATWLCKIEGLPRPSFADEMLWRQLSTSFGRDLLGWTAVMDVIGVSVLSRRIQGEVDKSGPKWPLAWRQLVVETQTQQATDPRDKLYSVLGLLNLDVVRPNYSLSVEDVFRDFAKLCIEADARPDHILML